MKRDRVAQASAVRLPIMRASRVGGREQGDLVSAAPEEMMVTRDATRDE